MPSIMMVNIDLYCDGNYPRGLSVLYQVDGHKSIQLNYVGSTTNTEVFRKDSIALNHNEYVTQIDMWKHEQVLQKIVIYIGTKRHNESDQAQNERRISAGCGRMGSLYRIKVNKDTMVNMRTTPLIFTGSYIDGYPFPRLANIGLKQLNRNDLQTPKLSFKRLYIRLMI